jgi:hypothetical protein
MRHIFSIVCIGLIIWLASDKIAATYPRENWVAVLKNPTKCNTREEMDKVVTLMMQTGRRPASGAAARSCRAVPRSSSSWCRTSISAFAPLTRLAACGAMKAGRCA